MLDLQGLTDELCSKLGRSIAVDNQHVEVIAASAQIGHIDAARSDAILNRRTHPELVEYVRTLNIIHAVEPVQVPPHPTLRTLPRWCFPLRHAGHLIGLLWVINEPSLTDEEVALASEYAREIRSILARNMEQAEEIIQRSVQLTNSLLREGHVEALAEAGRSGMLVTLGGASAWSLVVSRAQGQHTSVTTADLFELLADMLATNHPGSFIGAPIEDRLVLVSRNAVDGREKRSLLGAVELSCRRKGIVLRSAGIAELTQGVDPAEVLDRATFAATVARWEEQEELREWEQLGAWTLFKGKEWSTELLRSISVPAHTLVKLDRPELWRTLLTYLDSGTSAPDTCEKLHIHRATLYYRLGRIREIAGGDVLDSGWSRTSVHLALRMWRARSRLLEI